MSKPIGMLLAVKPEPEPDGSRLILVSGEGSEPLQILLTSDQVSELLEILQRGAVDLMQQRLPRYPQIEVDDVGIGYRGKSALLLVTTVELGTVALAGSTKVYRRIQTELDRALAFLSGQHH